MGIRLAPQRVALSASRWRGLELMAHQAECLEHASVARLLLEAPTGAGKTWAGAAPLLEAAISQGEGAFFVYPTNALADDQAKSLADVVRRAGYVPGIVSSAGSIDVAGADVLLCRVHSGAIEDAKEALGGRTRGSTLSRLLERLPVKPLWLLTNPDTLYLLCTARYSLAPQLWSRLGALRSLVLDEFHLYRGPTLVRALAIVELAAELLGVDRVRVLSATLPGAARALLTERLGFVPVAARTGAGGRVVQHEVQLHIEASQGEEATTRIAEIACDMLPTLRSERGEGRVPLLVLRNSVLAAAALEDLLVDQGVARDEIGVYRGLSSRSIRSVEGKSVVLGTSALEVGVDFATSRLVFEALSAGSFAQRLGRLARHSPGEAVFFTDERVAAALRAAGDMDRPRLLQLMASLLRADDDLAAFAASPFGRAVAGAAVDALRERASALGAPDTFLSRIDAAEQRLVNELGCQNLPPLEIMPRAVRARLRRAVGFRGGEGAIEVFDVRERDRRGSAELATYDVDLVTFFRRASWRGAPEKDKRPLIVGYAKARRLSLFLDMVSQVGVGLHAPNGEQIQLRVDGHATAWEGLLRRRDHIVGIFPADVRADLSWREDAFDSQDGRIALLDDDALVAAYLCWKRTAVPPT